MSPHDEALKRVPWLLPLPESVRDHIAATADTRVFPEGGVLVAELEPGEDVYIILAGRAEVSVEGPASVGAQRLNVLHPGDVLGEQAYLTGAPRAATVTAIEEVTALRIGYPLMESLFRCHPAIAVGLLDRLAARLGQTEQALASLLRPGAEVPRVPLPPAAHPRSGSLRRLFREAVTARQHDLPFLALTTFMATLILARAAVWLVGRAGANLLPILRGAYLLGIFFVVISTGLLLFRYRRQSRRLVAVGYGAGFALIFNELSVFLTFDIFWTDMTHRDPSLIFDPIRLYARSESQYAMGIGLAVLIQVTYFRSFYRRALFILKSRLGRLLSGRPTDPAPPAPPALTP